MSEKLAQEAVESRRKLELYEEAFRKIKEATGVRWVAVEGWPLPNPKPPTPHPLAQC